MRFLIVLTLAVGGCAAKGHNTTDAGGGDGGANADFAMAPDLASAIPRNGLVGEWLFSGNARDSSGRGHDGTDMGAALTKDRGGHVNAAFSFNGIDAYVDIPDADDLDLVDGYTVSAWVRADGLSQLAGIVSKYSSFGSQGFTMRLSNDVPYNLVDFNEASSHVTQDGGLQLDVGNWHHVLATTMSGSATVYLDGNLFYQGMTGYASMANSDPVQIGLDYDPSSGRFWKGAIDDVRLYNRVLSSDEIALLAAENP